VGAGYRGRDIYSMSSALFTTMCIEIKEVGATYSGTAVGLVLAISFIGRAFAPPLGNSLADINIFFAWPFILWAALAVVGVIILKFVKETGWRAEGKPVNESKNPE